MKCDVVVVGAGTSGLMAAISAASCGAKVVVVEQNQTAGKKLLLTGNGRCNVTNVCSMQEIIKHIVGNGKFLYSVFQQFNNQDIIAFFKELHVDLKVEDHGRVFPVSNRSKTILEALIHKAQSLGIVFQYQRVAKAIVVKNQQVVGLSTNQEVLSCDSVIMATGGASFPQTGSNGSGYDLIRRLGHHITPLLPSEVALVSKEPFILDKTLMGLSLKDVCLSVMDQHKKVVSHRLDFLFTHFGVSGPCVLRCSSFVVKALQHQKTVTLQLDVLPDVSYETLKASWHQKQVQTMMVKQWLKEYVPSRFAAFLLHQVSISEQQQIANVSKKQSQQLFSMLKEFRFEVCDSLPLQQAFVTMGGVSLKEIHAKTLESKLVKGLYFAGEIMDIHGYTGGYNITAAFAGGYVAGYWASQKKS